MRYKRFQIVLIATFFVAALSCTSNSSANAEIAAQSNASAPVAEPTPATLTTADVAKLKWIIGSWKGTGDVEKPFYERYRFEGESTLAVDGFPDETLAKSDSTTLFALKDGKMGNSGETRWAASEITADSITFVPVAAARNTFKWQRVSDNEWKAILSWPATADKPARQRVYKMERVDKK